MTTAIVNNTTGRVAKAKQGIETGLRVLGSIAGRHRELGAETEAARNETLAALEHDGVFKASKLVWGRINALTERAAGTEIARADRAFESVNGAMPGRKAEAARLLDGAKTDFVGRNYRDAEFKASRAAGLLEAIQRDSTANAEYAQSLRQSNWGVLEELAPRKPRKKR